jgi:hypothetical protein
MKPGANDGHAPLGVLPVAKLAAETFTPPRQVKTLFAEAREFSELPAVVAAVSEILRERHRGGSVYEVESMTTVVRLARAISAGLIIVFVLAAAVSVTPVDLESASGGDLRMSGHPV